MVGFLTADEEDLPDFDGVGEEQEKVEEEEEGSTSKRRRGVAPVSAGPAPGTKGGAQKRKKEQQGKGAVVAAPKKKAGSQQHPNPPRYKDVVSQVAQVSRDVAILMSICTRVFLLPATCLYVTDAQKIGRKYYMATKGKSGRHGLGPPYCHIWRGIIMCLSKEPDLTPQDKTIVDRHLQGAAKDFNTMMPWLKLARISKTFDETAFKFQYDPHPESQAVEKVLVAYLIKANGTEKQSIAPLGPRERRLTAYSRGGNKALQDANEEEEE